MPAAPRRQHRSTGLWLPLYLLAFTIVTDQLTKATARRLLAESGEMPVGDGLMIFSLVQNYAGFLGVVRDLPPSLQFLFLYVGVGCLLAGCLYYLLWRRPSFRYSLPVSLIAGGGLSNLLDRFLHGGGVTDFVILSVGNLRTGIFNLADVYILIGSCIFGFLLFSRPER